MSSFGEFEHKMRLALFQESQAKYGAYFSFGDLIDRYGLDWNEQWLDRLSEEWDGSFARAINRIHAKTRRDWSALISAQGMREIEELYGSKTGMDELIEPVSDIGKSGSFITTEDGVSIVTENGDRILAEFDEVTPSKSISSADWTGISYRLNSSPEIVEKISGHIREIDDLVDRTGLTNTERQKAKAITESLRLLVASPEPEWRVIATLLTAPPLTAILNVAAIAQIILKLFGIG